MGRWLLVALTALFAASARAQDSKSILANPGSRHEIALQLGAFRPTARFGINGVTGDKGERFGGTGFLFVIDYFHRVTSVLSAGLEGLHINRGTYELKKSRFRLSVRRREHPGSRKYDGSSRDAAPSSTLR